VKEIFVRISNNTVANIAAFASVVTTTAVALPIAAPAILLMTVMCNDSGKYPNCGYQAIGLGTAVVLTATAALAYTTKKLTACTMNHFFPEGQNVIRNKKI